MNKKLSISYAIISIALLSLGCQGNLKKGNKNNRATSSLSLHIGNEKYALIDTTESAVTWKGVSLIGANSHTGYVHISQGELMIEKGQLMGGTVEIDMHTIEDKVHGRDSKLINHLKGPDFFDVERFPFSTISITKVARINGSTKRITGNLTIKGIMHPVTFPAIVEAGNGTIKANGKLTIDRTLWNVRYKSGKFYDLLANQTLSDSIEFHINILAKNK